MPPVSELISHILLKKLRHEELTVAEEATLAQWEGRSAEHKAFIEMLLNEALLSEKLKGMLEQDEQSSWKKIEHALEAEWNERSPKVRKTGWQKFAVAALAVLVLGAGGYFLLNKKPADAGNTATAQPADIAPGAYRAKLTLSDGSVIDLVKATNGLIAKDSGVNVMKPEEGKVSYEGMNTLLQPIDLTNTLTTPRGGQYWLTLPDGTVVFLNAASSIRYPTTFSGNERRVAITGEVYFEVARQANNAFTVQVNSVKGNERATIEVLGTHFNVMAYDEETVIKTTLIEGKVKMGTAGNNSATLSPGQEAQISTNDKLSVSTADVEQAIAWKNGITSFKKADIKSIMRQISRWYDVEIVYEGNIPDRLFSGQIERSVNISSVLDILRYAGLKFKVEEKKITVLQ